MSDRWLDYDEFLRRLYSSATYVAEMPDEYYRSRPLPTLRWTVAGFASFAGGCRRRPTPSVYSPPDRWIVADATSARTAIYAIVDTCSFAAGPLEPYVSPPATDSLAEARARTGRIDELLGMLSPRYFDGDGGDDARRRELAALLAEETGGLIGWYQELVPDFFTWLQA